MQVNNQNMVYAEKWHIHYHSGSLEDKLDHLFSKPVQQPVLLKKINLHNFVPKHSKRWPGLQQIPRGKLEEE